jgi:hypothetical protein
LNFNDKTSHLKEHPLKFLRVEAKEHYSKTLLMESQRLKWMNNFILFFLKKIAFIIFIIGSTTAYVTFKTTIGLNYYIPFQILHF